MKTQAALILTSGQRVSTPEMPKLTRHSSRLYQPSRFALITLAALLTGCDLDCSANNGNRHGWDNPRNPHYAPPVSVPDCGSTAALLGIGITATAILARRRK